MWTWFHAPDFTVLRLAGLAFLFAKLGPVNNPKDHLVSFGGQNHNTNEVKKKIKGSAVAQCIGMEELIFIKRGRLYRSIEMLRDADIGA